MLTAQRQEEGSSIYGTRTGRLEKEQIGKLESEKRKIIIIVTLKKSRWYTGCILRERIINELKDSTEGEVSK